MGDATASDQWRSVFDSEDRAVLEIYRRRRNDEIRWASSALLVVDVTMAFLGPRLPTLEACKKIRTACGEPGWAAVDRIAELLKAFRSAHRQVVFTVPQWSAELHVGGTAAGETTQKSLKDPIASSIAPLPHEFVIEKPKASAFFATPLATYCIREGLSTVFITGATTSGCVRATAVDAYSYGLNVVMVNDACFDRARLSHNVALYELNAKYTSVMSTSQVIDELAAIALDSRI